MSNNCKILVLWILTGLFSQDFIVAQTETYIVEQASFSSKKYDEFSPVFYKNGIVFCSNMNQDLFVSYSTSENKNLFKILFVVPAAKTNWKSPVLFSKDLKSDFNDGPVTFNRAGDEIYFSRNLDDNSGAGNASRLRNRLGLFSSNMVEGKWNEIKEFRFNNEYYSVTTPSLSPDGKRIYFASDKPGGFGGSDLYYCDRLNDYWDNPVNLGPVINTPGNESYPFINSAGELFFSSDGHPGLGKKDIFFSRFADSVWMEPVALDPPINSKWDDFGIVTDAGMTEGYFTSNRGLKSIDIFHFKTLLPQQFYSESQKDNQFCFHFNDDNSIAIDTLFLQIEWDFGDGVITTGANVGHCFTGFGYFPVKQNIVDKKTDRIFFSKLLYNLEIREIEQPYITCEDVALVNDSMHIDGLKSNMPGFEILNYSWDFGDGTKATGDAVYHTFNKPGEYIIKLGLSIKEDSTGVIKQQSVFKKVRIFEDSRLMLSFKDDSSVIIKGFPDVMNYDHAFIEGEYSAKTELEKDAVFQLEILSTKTRITQESVDFRNILNKYFIKEIYTEENRTYSYIVREEQNLSLLYPAFNDLISLGYNDVRIKTAILTDPAEKELNSIKKVYSSSTDDLFRKDETRLTSDGLELLDQIAGLMKKYPEIKIVMEVHTDNTGQSAMNLLLSRKRAQNLSIYLASRGISEDRLIAYGYGDLSPVAQNNNPEERKKNRRVEFVLIY
jgi:outer membrane protein OmpA-like peptidoglycan-associated protein